MQIESDQDFPKLRRQFNEWRKRFPMFTHDVVRIERIIEEHIQKYSIALVKHRQTHSKSYLEQAQQEIDTINQVIATVEKMELMSMLSRG
jgi:hypothetical protein